MNLNGGFHMTLNAALKWLQILPSYDSECGQKMIPNVERMLSKPMLAHTLFSFFLNFFTKEMRKVRGPFGYIFR